MTYKYLTPQILRDATDGLLLEHLDYYRDKERYMCFAVEDAVDINFSATCREFQNMLQDFDVSTTGALVYAGVSYDALDISPPAQYLRFDFLNLLAHYLEDDNE